MKINQRVMFLLSIVSMVLWVLALYSLNVHLPLISSASAEKSQSQTTASHEDIPDSIMLVAPGLPRDLKSGDSIPLYMDMMARFDITKGDTRFSRNLDLFLFHKTSSQPIEDATVQIMGKMRYMGHGDFLAIPLQSNAGHYVVPLSFSMPGEWLVDLDIRTLGKQTKMQLEIDLYE